MPHSGARRALPGRSAPAPLAGLPWGSKAVEAREEAARVDVGMSPHRTSHGDRRKGMMVQYDPGAPAGGRSARGGHWSRCALSRVAHGRGRTQTRAWDTAGKGTTGPGFRSRQSVITLRFQESVSLRKLAELTNLKRHTCNSEGGLRAFFQQSQHSDSWRSLPWTRSG